MDVNVSFNGSSIKLSFLLEQDDGRYNEKISMANPSMTVNVNRIDSVEEIHPDHLALGIILASNPFVGTELNIPLAVSQPFRDAAKTITKYKINFLQTSSKPYVPSKSARPGLSFSGGADSTAALLLMPENTLSVFMDRPIDRSKSMYNKSAAYATIQHANELGYEMLRLGCDLEYMRDPIGFPTDLAPAIPLIFVASKYNVDSIAFGTVLESAYRVGHEHARDYESSGHYKVWGSLFRAAGLPLYLPVAGISEVGTSKIVLSSSFKDYTRSCIRGNFPESCENCWKCFRKNLVEKRLLNVTIQHDEMKRWLTVREVKRKLSAWPISHENVLSWSLKGDNTIGEIATDLLDRTEGAIRNLTFLERWFHPSIQLIPSKYQLETEGKISNYMERMRDFELVQITNHTMTKWLTSEQATKARKNFNRHLL